MADRDTEKRCTCDWTAGTSIMPGTENTGYPMPAASRIPDPDCPASGHSRSQAGEAP